MPDRTFLFRSLTRKDYAYAFSTDGMAYWDSAYRACGALSPHMGEFRTYGDGMTAHTPTYAVVRENFADYCSSFAAFLIENAQKFTAEELRAIAYGWPIHYEWSVEQIQFALSVKYVEGKIRYFTTTDNNPRISSSSKLQHDKRWHRITEHHKGDAASVVWVLRQRTDGEDPASIYAFESYALHARVRDVMVQLGGAFFGASSMPGRESGLIGREVDVYDAENNAVLRNADDAFSLLKRAWWALRDLYFASETLKHYKYNNKIDQPEPEAKKEEVAQ